MADIGERDDRKGCFKIGCLGCLAVLALAIALPVILGLAGFLMGVPDADYESVDLSQPLPEIPAGAEAEGRELPLAPPGTAVPTEDLESGSSRRLELESALSPAPPAGAVHLDFGMGEFTVRAAEPGEGIRVEGDYDRASFDLEEEFEEAVDGSWKYSVRLRNRVSWLRRIWGGGDVDNSLTVYLPRNHPMSVSGTLSMGRTEVDLGGLWITEVDLELETGEHLLRFSEPTTRPLSDLHLEASWGEITLGQVGNASPASTSLSGQGGEFRVDLTGDWRSDGEVGVEFRFGECRVTLPENARVEVDRTSLSFGERQIELPEGQAALPPDAPVVSLSLSGSFGEIRATP